MDPQETVAMLWEGVDDDDVPDDFEVWYDVENDFLWILDPWLNKFGREPGSIYVGKY